MNAELDPAGAQSLRIQSLRNAGPEPGPGAFAGRLARPPARVGNADHGRAAGTDRRILLHADRVDRVAGRRQPAADLPGAGRTRWTGPRQVVGTDRNHGGAGQRRAGSGRGRRPRARDRCPPGASPRPDLADGLRTGFGRCLHADRRRLARSDTGRRTRQHYRRKRARALAAGRLVQVAESPQRGPGDPGRHAVVRAGPANGADAGGNRRNDHACAGHGSDLPRPASWPPATRFPGRPGWPRPSLFSRCSLSAWRWAAGWRSNLPARYRWCRAPRCPAGWYLSAWRPRLWASSYFSRPPGGTGSGSCSPACWRGRPATSAACSAPRCWPHSSAR